MLYLLYTFLLFLVTYGYYKYALASKILDNPNHRSSHTVPTVRGGGMVFFVAVLLYFVYQFKIAYPYFLSGFILLSVLGFIDDKKALSAKMRFPFQLLAVGLILYEAGLFTSGIPVWAIIIGFIVAVGFINAFNFMDGINGITGFYTLAVILPLLWVNSKHPVFDHHFFYFILLAIGVFGFFNFRKQALMFAGDIGSMSLAAVLLFWLTKMMIDLKSPILLAFVVVYGVDSALTILNRLKHRENIFEAHRWHLYQKFGDLWHWQHLKTAAVYMIIQLLISVFITKYIAVDLSKQLIVLIAVYVLVSVIYILFYKYFDRFQKRKM